MRSDITPERIANAILQNTRLDATYLIIEGVTDLLIYGKFTLDLYCEINIAHGNQNVIEVLDILSTRGFGNAIGIIDADFRVLNNEIIDRDDLFFTEYHDLELMAFQSPAFEWIINYYAIPERVTQFLAERTPKNLRTIFLELIRPLGYLKWANKKFNLGLTFKPKTADGNELNLGNFILVDTLEYAGDRKMIEAVINYSVNKSEVKTTVEDALSKINSLTDNSIDLMQLCNGHDIISLISLSLKRRISNRNSAAIKPEQIQKEIFFAYDSRFFEQTRLYAELKAWEFSQNKAILKF